jgi:hypothetical protein
VAIVGMVAVAGSSGATLRADRYSRAEVRQAFAAQGLRLSSRWLHVWVLSKSNPKPTIEVVVGRRPKRKCHGCIVVHFPAPKGGAKAHVKEIEQDNVALAYLAGHGVGPRVSAALATLRS